jgi:hypothetical protein
MLVRLSETIRLLLLFTRRKEEPRSEREERQTESEEIHNLLAHINERKKMMNRRLNNLAPHMYVRY